MPTFYVRPVNGDDTNDGQSFASAFKTTQKAILGVTTDTGDEYIYLVSEGIEEVNHQVDLLRDSRTNPVLIRAVSSAGVLGATLGLNTYTIRATAGTWTSITGVLGMSAGSDGWDYNDDYRLYDVVLDANNVAAYGFYHISNQAKNVGAFYNCRFTNATDSGILMGGYNACTLYNCEADNNTNYGWRPPGSNRGNSNWYNCSFHDNGSGVWLGNATYFYSCKIYNNTNYGFFGVDRYAYENIIHNCSIYGNGSHGLYINNSSNDADKIAANKFINNTFIGNGGYGIKSNAILGINYLSYGNLFDQNTSGPYDFTGVSYEAYPNQEIIAPADFDLSTGQFNYSSNTTNSRIPWGGAIGSVSREDFSITTSGSLTFATGDVGTTVVVSGKSFQKISNSPIVWNVI